jgi:hypothetical protein
MNLLESYLSYLEEQSPIMGYMNYMEDRYKIMGIHTVAMTKCFRKFGVIPDPMKKRLRIYECENPVIEDTIQKIRGASEKCENTKFPEKCSEFYNGLIPKLEYKLKFNKSQIDTLNRKTGNLKYD